MVCTRDTRARDGRPTLSRLMIMVNCHGCYAAVLHTDRLSNPFSFFFSSFFLSVLVAKEPTKLGPETVNLTYRRLVYVVLAPVVVVTGGWGTGGT